jgi:hypothetical protein
MTTNPVPTDRRYTDIHSWLALASDQRLDDHPLRVGITETAVEGVRIIAVELPRVRTAVEAGEACALIWVDPPSSTQYGSDISVANSAFGFVSVNDAWCAPGSKPTR